MTVLRTYARLWSDDMAASLPLLRTITGEHPHMRMTFESIELAAIGDFLVIAGPAAERERYTDASATVVVSDLDALQETLESSGATITTPVTSGPTGRFLYARHADGIGIEYVEWLPDLVAAHALPRNHPAGAETDGQPARAIAQERSGDSGDVENAQPSIPFRPVPRDFPGHPMPPTVPQGVRLELSRSRIVPGREAEFDEWMRMLTDRYEESVAVLPAERSVLEATFRHVESDGSTWIYHFTLVGQDGSGLDESNPIDADHAAYSRRVKEPGWEELEPRFMLVPAHLRKAIQQWALTGSR